MHLTTDGMANMMRFNKSILNEAFEHGSNSAFLSNLCSSDLIWGIKTKCLSLSSNQIKAIQLLTFLLGLLNAWNVWTVTEMWLLEPVISLQPGKVLLK